MTTLGFSHSILKNVVQSPKDQIDEAAAIEAAQLISGSLIYRLYESLIRTDYDMDAVTEHLEMLFDTDNHFALLLQHKAAICCFPDSPKYAVGIF